MITNKGKEIISKYMLGQVPSYATHISLGCGSKPNSTGDFSEKQTMDFEMLRVPISSKGFVNEGGISKLALSAEIPTEDRYEITEVGLWSAGANTNAAFSDSRVIFAFSSNENWRLHTPTTTSPVPEQFSHLNPNSLSNDIIVEDNSGNPLKVFATNADNSTMLSAIRKDRQEGARFLNYSIFMRGDTSQIDSNLDVQSSTHHIHIEGKTLDLSRNTPNDQLKLALSIVPQQESNTVLPYATRIVVEFLQSETTPEIGYAKFSHNISASAQAGNNRYHVITKKLSELETSSDFSWANVRMARIYVSVYEESTSIVPSSEYYVILDSMRFDNVTTQNPLYVMTGYGVVNTPLARPIYKISNTTNYIEFRLSVGVT
jgi:hypothetical protein